MPRALVVVVAMALLVCGCAAATVQEESTLHVDLPPELTGNYVHSEALFGRPSYGGSITGRAVYGTAGNRTGCHPIIPDPSWPKDPIIIVDRGECKFTTKVRNGELAGASAVIIVDNKPLCGPAAQGGSPQCPSCAGCYFNGCECRLPYLAGDSSGNSISIPAAMVSQYDGEQFINCTRGDPPCNSPQPLVVTFEWSLPTSSGVVDWEFWTISLGANSQPFLDAFHPYVKYFASNVHFEPHYFIFDGRNWGCTLPNGHGGYRCDTQCTNQGRYCAPDPDPDRNRHAGINGYDVIKENLRQICIWTQVANVTYSSTYGEQWWNYVALFSKNCQGDLFKSDQCSEAQQRAAGIDPAVVTQCMADSGGLSDHGDNTLLARGLAQRTSLNIVLLPTIIVNGVIERGSASASQVAQTICSGYTEGTEPDVCKCVNVNVNDIDACLSGGTGTGTGTTTTGGSTTTGGTKVIEEEGGLAGWAIALLVLAPLLTIAIAATFYVLHRRSRREMAEILRQYQTLPGQGGDDDGGAMNMDPNMVHLQLRPMGAPMSTAPMAVAGATGVYDEVQESPSYVDAQPAVGSGAAVVAGAAPGALAGAAKE